MKHKKDSLHNSPKTEVDIHRALSYIMPIEFNILLFSMIICLFNPAAMEKI